MAVGGWWLVVGIIVGARAFVVSVVLVLVIMVNVRFDDSSNGVAGIGAVTVLVMLVLAGSDGYRCIVPDCHYSCHYHLSLLPRC